MPDVSGIAGDKLRSLIERIEKLEAEKKQLGDDIKDIYSEAKRNHFDVPIMKKIVRERRMNKDDLEEQQNLLELYRKAIGMWEDTPLGEYAFADAAE